MENLDGRRSFAQATKDAATKVREHFKRKPTLEEIALDEARAQDDQTVKEVLGFDLKFGGATGEEVTVDLIKTHFALRQASAETSYKVMIVRQVFNKKRMGVSKKEIEKDVEFLESRWPSEEHQNCVKAQQLDTVEGIEKAREFFSHNVERGLRHNGHSIEVLEKVDHYKDNARELRRRTNAYQAAVRVLDERKADLFPDAPMGTNPL